MVESVLEPNCKRFRKTAIQEKFNVKSDPQMERGPNLVTYALYSPKQRRK